MLFYTAAQRGLASLQELLTGLAGFYENNLFLSNFFEFLELPSRVVEPARPRALPSAMGAGFALTGVSFRYPRAEHDALEGVNLTIRPGEVVALVGENGAGKSTLVKLLCRLYDPSAGSVTLDGVPLSELPLADLPRADVLVGEDQSVSRNERSGTAARALAQPRGGQPRVIEPFARGLEPVPLLPVLERRIVEGPHPLVGEARRREDQAECNDDNDGQFSHRLAPNQCRER